MREGINSMDISIQERIRNAFYDFLEKHRLFKIFIPWLLTIHRLPYKLKIIYSFISGLGQVSFWRRIFLLERFYLIHIFVDCLHKQGEIFEIVKELFKRKDLDGLVVQAGIYKGGCTAKLSLACKMLGKRLVAFDSFEGLPENEEGFPAGAYKASLDEAMKNIKRFGAPDVCKVIKGRFESTLPEFAKGSPELSLVFLDVDLSSSTAVCLRYLYPLLRKGGIIFSHDGHLPPVIKLLSSREFWESIGFPKPRIEGLGTRKLIKIVKE
jgi:hypothetical protein